LLRNWLNFSALRLDKYDKKQVVFTVSRWERAGVRVAAPLSGLLAPKRRRAGYRLPPQINKRSLKTVRAYHWKESFRLFWEYEQPHAASKYLRRWCRGANKSRLKPVKAFVKTLRKHEDLILNWFRAKKRFSSGVVEAMNRGAGLVSNLARGFRNPEIRRIALFHTLGDLPMPPEYTHRFS